MSLTLIKEDGSGDAEANSYADVADCTAYHEGHLYASAWTGATLEKKTAALVMAARVIDASYQFNGFVARPGQALQWPRVDCRDPDREDAVWVLSMSESILPSDKVPKAVVDATCEMARELLIVDRTAAPPGEGILSQDGADFSATTYSKLDTRPIISHLTQAMLAKLGSLIGGGSGAVRLVRV